MFQRVRRLPLDLRTGSRDIQGGRRRTGLKLKVMEGEDRKTHTPARPPEKYVLYRAMTWTGGLCAQQLNGMGVYSIQ